MAVPTSPKTLLSLPAELHIEIAAEVDDDELRSLHHTCRKLSANTMDVYVSRFFRRRRHLYSTHALTALRDITAVPHLARHIQHIELLAVLLKADDRIFTTDQERHAAQTSIQTSKLWYDNECAELQEHGTERLVQIFTNLKNLGAGRHLKLTNSRLPRMYGLQELSRGDHKSYGSMCSHKKWDGWGLADFLFSIRPWTTFQNAGNIKPLERQVISALARSEHLFESLYYQGHASATKQCRAENLWTVSDSRLTSICVSRSSLKVLILDLEDRITMDALAHLLRSATGLAELSLGTPHASNLEMFCTIVQKHRLTSITLCHTRCKHLDIVRFLASHAKTLKHLELSGLKLLKGKGWAFIFLLASKRLRLKSLRLRDLFEHPSNWSTARYYLAGGKYKYGFVVEESDERCMRGLLADLARDELYKVPEPDEVETPLDITGFDEWKPEAIEELRAWEEWRACEDGDK